MIRVVKTLTIEYIPHHARRLMKSLDFFWENISIALYSWEHCSGYACTIEEFSARKRQC